jgi:hypothetical protein
MGNTTDTINANLLSLGMNNPSQLSTANEIANGIGIVIDETIQEMTNSENNILNIINTQRYGKSGYYTSIAKQFQYGYNLSVDPVTLAPYYAVIDPTAQIVSQAAFEELASGNSSQLFLKIATLNTLTNQLQALSTPQLAGFNNYFINFEIPGVPVTVISADPNQVNFLGTATYFATYDLSVLTTNLQNALLAFRNSFAFNGEFFSGDLQDYIKTNVPGIRDFYIYNTMIDNVPFSGSQSLSSGYFDYVSSIFTQITYNATNG